MHALLSTSLTSSGANLGCLAGPTRDSIPKLWLIGLEGWKISSEVEELSSAGATSLLMSVLPKISRVGFFLGAGWVLLLLIDEELSVLAAFAFASAWVS